MIESRISLRDSLRNIYKEVEAGHFLLGDTPAMKKVSETFNLDTLSSMVFSYLYCQGDEFTSEEYLFDHVFYGKDIRDGLCKLVKDGVVECDWFPIRIFYRVSGSYRAHVNELILEMDEDDLVKQIADALPSDVMVAPWRDDLLGQSYRKEQNRRFVEAFKSVNYRAMDLETQNALWFLLYNFIKNYDVAASCKGKSGGWSIDKAGMAELVSKGIAVIGAKDSSDDNLKYLISPWAVHLFFHGREDLVRYDSLSNEADLIRWEDIEEKELYFSEDSQRDVDRLKFILSREGFERAQGIFDKLHRKHAVISLFWGPPGTGKTEVIKQLARQSQRNIFIMDAAKLTASGWGETEKLYRKVFASYRYLEALSSNVPILLFNEADQFLGKRLSNTERSIDKCENVISNIILQNFEDFEGILLATTNLVENIDPAFDRRFLFKTRLDRPNAAARQKIWSFYVPELTAQEAQNLAESFELTGSEICNIATKRALAELYETGDRGYDYIVNLCVSEGLPLLGKNRDERKRVGF